MTHLRMAVTASVLFVVLGMGALVALKADVVRSDISGVIAAPPELVWEYITEPEFRAQWMQYVVDAAQMYRDPGIKGGTMLLMVSQEGFKVGIYEEVAEAEMPQHIRYLIEQDTANVMTTYELTFKPEGTVLTIKTERYLKKGWARILAAFLRDPGEKNLRHNLDALKKLVEANT